MSQVRQALRVPGLLTLAAIGAMATASLLHRPQSARGELLAFLAQVERPVVGRVERTDSLVEVTCDDVADDWYERAHATLQRHVGRWQRFVRSGSIEGRGNDPEVVELRQLCEEAMQQIERGASSRFLESRGRWGGFAWIVAAECKWRVAERRVTSAMRLWSSALAVGLDRARVDSPSQPVMLGSIEVLSRTWDEGTLRRLDRDALCELERVLSRVESQVMRLVDVRHIVGQVVRHCVDDETCDQRHGMWDSLRAWRAGFSPHELWMRDVLDSVRSLQEWERPAAAWGARQAQLAPHRHVAYGVESTEEQQRRTLTAIRMLRMAIQVHLDQPITPLIDAFLGTPIEVETQPHAIYLRSAGGLERAVSR